MDFVRQRWDQNNPSVKQLFAELQVQGFTGSYASLNRAIHNQLGVQNLKKSCTPSLKPIKYFPRQTAWAIFQPETELKAPKIELCRTLCELSPLADKARKLAHTFREMISYRQHDYLDEWLVQAEGSQIIELVRFAAGLRSDYKAIKAALIYSWSNGQVEGQVNRLKLIKRQMYGRAGFALLRRRVLCPAPAS
jgi:transposase